MTSVHHSELTDLQLCLVDAKAGSRLAVDQLFGRCREYLLYIASRELAEDLRVKVGASDLVQESLLKAHRDFGDFRGQTDAELRSWLRQILIRTFLDAHRKYKISQRRGMHREVDTERPSTLESPTETASVQMMTGESHAALASALQQLPEDYRTVIRERIWQKKSFVEIAAGMNRTPDAVRKLWFRGVDQLRKIWQVAHDGADVDKRRS